MTLHPIQRASAPAAPSVFTPVEQAAHRSRRGARSLERREAHEPRQGVILLVVLVMLTLFTMMLITFVLSTSNNRQSVTASSRTEQSGDPPPTVTQDAFLQLVRGSKNPDSVIGAHSLMEDIYGNRGVRGQITTVLAASTNSPITYFQVDAVLSAPTFPPTMVNGVNVLPPTNGFYAGRVITMLTGQCAGQSSRIVDYNYNLAAAPNPLSTFQVLAFEGGTPAANDRFLINGQAFAGTGFGFRPASFYNYLFPSNPDLTFYTRLLDAQDNNSIYDASNGVYLTGAPPYTMPYALLPNQRRGLFVPPNVPTVPPAAPPAFSSMFQYLDAAGPGGANEEYDAPDFQNMLLSMTVWNPTLGATGSFQTILPSLHRPDLINYWQQPNRIPPPAMGTRTLFPAWDTMNSKPFPIDPVSQQLLRKIVMRPLPFDHPNFTGSNSRMTTDNMLSAPGPNGILNPLIYGPWDVDNDGDGVPDSIWVDMGLPVQTGADGRRYKPLVAVLVVDLDGRLNVNAHSSWRHVPTAGTVGTGNPVVTSRLTPVYAPLAGGAVNNAYLKVGQGYGPPEISLHPIFEPHQSDYGNPQTITIAGELTKVLGGDNNNQIEGRYGEIQLYTNPTLAGGGLPGISMVDDPLGWLSETQYPRVIFGAVVSAPMKQNIHLPTLSSFGPFGVDVTQFTGLGQWKFASGFGSPPDLDGDGMLALDMRGQPLYIDYGSLTQSYAAQTPTYDTGWGEHNEAVDDAYELDLSLKGFGGRYSATSWSSFMPNLLTGTQVSPADAPFTAAEIERVLRSHDVDASTLADRLPRLAPNAFTQPDGARLALLPRRDQMRGLVTHASYDVPVPPGVFDAPYQSVFMYNLAPTANPTVPVPPMTDSNITQLIRARLVFNNPAVTAVTINGAINELLPPEILRGEKLDLNRLLGNGRDDNGNGVVDEPGEVEKGWVEMYGAGNPVPFDLLNLGNPAVAGTDANNDYVWDDTRGGLTTSPTPGADGVLDARDAPDMLARQRLAKHLYVLMMLLKGENFKVNADLNGDGLVDTSDNSYYLAQLAVNIVDFRDRDSIMTPFEFDINPFQDDDGSGSGFWEVDGVVTPFGSGATRIDPTTVSLDDVHDATIRTTAPYYRGLVWGCERPELVITETLATHDRRSGDSTKDASGKQVKWSDPTWTEKDYDQVRRPQGTLALEIFNPNPPLNVGNRFAGQAPGQLEAPANVDVSANNKPQFGVNLAQTSPPGVVGGAPVWRIATTRIDSPRPLQQGVRAATLPSQLTNIAQPKTNIDRVLYFTTGATPLPSNLAKEGYRQFYVQTIAETIIPPNSYAVVAPASKDLYGPTPSRFVTYLGGRNTATDPGTITQVTDVRELYPVALYFAPSPFSLINNNVTVPTASDIKPAVSIPVAPVALDTTGITVVPTSDPTASRTVRFSVTEPDGGYPVPGVGANPGQTIGGDPFNDNVYYNQSVAIPGMPYDQNPANFSRLAANASDQLRQTFITIANGDKSTSQITTVYLQRLANPTLPWDAIANPYIIVDQMPVDLTAYNSEKPNPPPSDHEEFQGITTYKYDFDSRRRGVAQTDGSAGTINQVNRNNVWLQYSSPLINQGPNSITTPLTKSTLGYLNLEYGPVAPSPNRWSSTNQPTLSTNVGMSTVNTLPSAAGEYRGDPLDAAGGVPPFAWLTWNDRPFISGKELLLVPVASPATLLSEMTLSQSTNPLPNWAGPFTPPTGPPFSYSVYPIAEFGHLANFLLSPPYVDAAATPLPAPNLNRLLEYVDVPSRFAGTQTWVPPLNTQVVQNPGPTPHFFHPPFNRVSQYRDPGKVNINTIVDPFVWQGIMDERVPAGTTDQVTGSTPAWLNLYQMMWTSRQGALTPMTTGYVTNPAALLAASASANLPSIFGRPFRSSSGNPLAPVTAMRAGPGGGVTEQEVAATMLRPLPADGTYPLFQYPGKTAFWDTNAQIAGGNPAFADARRNPYFAYKDIIRLDNLLTTRSNVYAVWITVGYFEVTAAPTPVPAAPLSNPTIAEAWRQYNAAYPDGWQLGAEIGSDTGDIHRNRAFYIYDRTIPVGFERGENHNVEQGILLERFIE